MKTIDEILKAITTSTDAAAGMLTLADRVAGRVGRGGSRWHRWRELRLRLRAVKIEDRRPTKARALRTAAAIHLTHALRIEGFVDGRDEKVLVMLAAGIEPESRS